MVLHSRMDDIQCMRRLAGGDAAAMDELVERWQGPLLGYVQRFLGADIGDTEDLVQEVFLRAWRHRRRWRPTAAVSTWLFTIAGNLCRNRLRNVARRPINVAIDPLKLEPGGAADDPEARADAAHTAALLRRTILDLPEAQRQALLLKRFGGLTYRQISEVMGTTPKAVDALLLRARRRLLQELDANCGLEREGIRRRRG